MPAVLACVTGTPQKLQGMSLLLFIPLVCIVNSNPVSCWNSSNQSLCFPLGSSFAQSARHRSTGHPAWPIRFPILNSAQPRSYHSICSSAPNRAEATARHLPPASPSVVHFHYFSVLISQSSPFPVHAKSARYQPSSVGKHKPACRRRGRTVAGWRPTHGLSSPTPATGTLNVVLTNGWQPAAVRQPRAPDIEPSPCSIPLLQRSPRDRQGTYPASCRSITP